MEAVRITHCLAVHMAELLFSAPFPGAPIGSARRSRRVLETCAGDGRLVEAVIDVVKTQRIPESIHLTLVESDTRYFSKLATLGNVLHQADFLKLPRSVLGAPFGRGNFDRIIMAPPVAGEAEHVVKAFSMLAPGGRLVALVTTAYRTFTGPSYVELREIVNSRPRKDGARHMIADDIRIGQYGMDRYGVVLVLDA